MKKLYRYTGFTYLLFLAQLGFADVKLPGIIGNNMVLQRNTPLAIWGWADPGEDVNILFRHQNITTSANASGNWFMTLNPSEAGGPYDMVISGKNSIRLENILIGEVWLCSGQSNMEWKLDWLKDQYAEEISKSSNNKIRLLDVKNKIAGEPEKDIQTDGWKVSDPNSVNDFSAVAYFFGRELFKQYNVPIGLISSEWGGTVVEAWASKNALRAFPEFRNQVEYMNNVALTAAIADYQAQEKEWNKNLLNVEKLANSGKRSWFEKKFSDKDWKAMKVPGYFENEIGSDFDGVVWYRKEVNIPKSMAGKDLVLSLGLIDDIDTTWFNGKIVGGTQNHNTDRKYTIPGKLVKSGKNFIAVRVVDTGGGGGFWGTAEDMQLYSNAEAIQLSGDWKYKVAVNMNHLPPRPANPENPNQPTVLFNAMISPLKQFPIKGVIWYQGESNVSRAKQYQSLFPALIEDWRNQWQKSTMPFLFVQLANFMEAKETPEESAWAELREAQLKTLSLPNTGMAVIIDIGDADDIHPKNKHDVGKRLALAARKIAYGEDIVFSGPIYEAIAIDGNKARINFKHTGSGLEVKNQNGELKEFTIAGADKKFYRAKARIENNEVVLESEHVQEPVAVRYAWADNPENANLYNKEGLPASPFRTDSWEGITK